jgi:hypothetical protein
MLASILIGLAALVAVSLAAALFLFAYLKGRVRRSTALLAAIAGMAIGGTIAVGGTLGSFPLGPMAVPFGVFLMLAAAINGVLAYQASKR